MGNQWTLNRLGRCAWGASENQGYAEAGSDYGCSDHVVHFGHREGPGSSRGQASTKSGPKING
jgi:hypothetical protein